MKDPPLLIPGMSAGWVNNKCGQSELKLSDDSCGSEYGIPITGVCLPAGLSFLPLK